MRPVSVSYRGSTILAAICVSAAALIGVRGTAEFMSGDVVRVPSPIVVPAVVGESLCRAQRDLRQKGLTVVKVTGRRSDLVELPATVVSQIPAAAENYREPEPVLLDVVTSRSVNVTASLGEAKRVTSRAEVARRLRLAGLPEAAVLGIGKPAKLYAYRSGACEPVFATTYRMAWGRATLIQTVGQILPKGREVPLRGCCAQKLGHNVYWRERFYILGLAPANKRLTASVSWLRIRR